MSHFSQIKTAITRKQNLIEALKKVDNGRWSKSVEVHEKAEHLWGYEGKQRPETAEIIIRRKDVGGSSNDIGFKQQADGTFQAIISEYDSGRYNQKWLDSLTQKYAGEVVKEIASDSGFSFTESMVDGELVIHCHTTMG